MTREMGDAVNDFGDEDNGPFLEESNQNQASAASAESRRWLPFALAVMGFAALVAVVVASICGTGHCSSSGGDSDSLSDSQLNNADAQLQVNVAVGVTSSPTTAGGVVNNIFDQQTTSADSNTDSATSLNGTRGNETYLFDGNNGTSLSLNTTGDANSTYQDYFGAFEDLVSTEILNTPFDPYVRGDCDFSDNFQPHVLLQCECYSTMSIVADDTLELYVRLRSTMASELYGGEKAWNTTDEPATSCSPRNQALLWLASGDTRRSGDLAQRFIATMLYVSLNGTQWDDSSRWLSDANECLWLGLECNEQFQITGFALERVNAYGQV